MGFLNDIFGTKKQPTANFEEQEANSQLMSAVPKFDLMEVFRSVIMFFYAMGKVERAWAELVVPTNKDETPFLLVSIKMKDGFNIDTLMRSKDFPEVMEMTQHILKSKEYAFTEMSVREVTDENNMREEAQFFPAPVIEILARERGLIK